MVDIVHGRRGILEPEHLHLLDSVDIPNLSLNSRSKLRS